MALMEGKINFEMPFNVNGIEVIGYIKYNERDTFIEIVHKDSEGIPHAIRKLYNGSMENKEQMVAEIENLIGEYLDIEE